jgi:hypothetical protein
MGQLESLRELSIAPPDQKKRKKRKEKENKALAMMPWSFNLMEIPVNFEILSHCTLKLI